MPHLIGLHGSKGAGKDTAFLALRSWAEKRGVLAVRRGFADKLKLSAARIFYPDITLEEAIEWADRIKVDSEHADGYIIRDPIEIGIGRGIIPPSIDSLHKTTEMDKPVAENFEATLTGREFLQRFGTESHRDVFGKDFWVDALLPLAGGDRDENIKWPYQFGNPPPDIAVITDVRFENEAKRIMDLGGKVWKIIRSAHGGEQEKDTHASEVELSDFLVYQVIFNKGSQEVFASTVRSVADEHFRRAFT